MQFTIDGVESHIAVASANQQIPYLASTIGYRAGPGNAPLEAIFWQVLAKKKPYSESKYYAVGLVPPIGIEPTAFCSGGRRSIH